MLEPEALPYKKPSAKKTPKKGATACPETDNGRHLYEWFLDDIPRVIYYGSQRTVYTPNILVNRCIGCGRRGRSKSWKVFRNGETPEYYGLLSELEA